MPCCNSVQTIGQQIKIFETEEVWKKYDVLASMENPADPGRIVDRKGKVHHVVEWTAAERQAKEKKFCIHDNFKTVWSIAAAVCLIATVVLALAGSVFVSITGFALLGFLVVGVISGCCSASLYDEFRQQAVLRIKKLWHARDYLPMVKTLFPTQKNDVWLGYYAEYFGKLMQGAAKNAADTYKYKEIFARISLNHTISFFTNNENEIYRLYSNFVGTCHSYALEEEDKVEEAEYQRNLARNMAEGQRANGQQPAAGNNNQAQVQPNAENAQPAVRHGGGSRARTRGPYLDTEDFGGIPDRHETGPQVSVVPSAPPAPQPAPVGGPETA